MSYSSNNNINYAEVFIPILDAQVKQQAMTGWMDGNAERLGIEIDGNNKVHIPKMDMDGLADYSRTAGYTRGAVSLTYEERSMTQDRGRQFFLDSMDVNEANFVPSATRVMTEFQRLKVIPEIDAYRLSKLATVSITADYLAEYGYTPAKATIVDVIIDAMASIRKQGFRNVPLVMMARTDVVSALSKAKADKGEQVAFTQNGIKTMVPAVDGMPILEVDDERLVSAITLKSDEEGGFDKALTGLDVNFIICPLITPLAVTKQNNMKVFTPEQVQNADAWLIDYRRYHDAWVLDSMVNSIAVNLKDAKPQAESSGESSGESNG